MKNKRFIILTILILAVGFASISTALYITGNLAIVTNNNDYDIYFSGAIVDGEDKTNELVIDKKHIVYKTKELKKVNDESVLEYEVTNGSTQYDADVVITCTPNSTDYYDVITTPNSFTIEAGHVETGIVTVKQKKYSTEIIEEEFICELVANATERTSTGSSISENEPYAISGVLKDKTGNILPNLDLIIYSETPHYVKTDKLGYFYVNNLEKGIHEIYYNENGYNNKTKNDIKNESNFEATVTTNGVLKIIKGDYTISEFQYGKTLEDNTYLCDGEWCEFVELAGYNPANYESFDVFLTDTDIVNDCLSKRDSIIYLSQHPNLINEIKKSNDYVSNYAFTIINSSSISNIDKYRAGLPFYLFMEGQGLDASITGPLSQIGSYGSYTYNSNYIGMSLYSSSGRWDKSMYLGTSTLDLTNYSKLYVDFTNPNSQTDYGATVGLKNNRLLDMCSGCGSTLTYNYTLYYQITGTRRKEYININNVNNVYFGVSAWGENINVNIYIYKVLVL